MWRPILASRGDSSSAVTRTLARSAFGQPPPKRFAPHIRQNVFALPSGSANLCSSSSPSRMRIDDGGTPRLTVPAPPDSFLQLVQWQKLRVSGGSSTSKATAPQRQLPRMALTRPSLYIAATFLAAAAYEVAVALRWIAMPLEPGADPTGQGVVLVAVLAAIAAT